MSFRRDQLCKQMLINGRSDEVYKGVRGVPFKDKNARGIPFAARAKWCDYSARHTF